MRKHDGNGRLVGIAPDDAGFLAALDAAGMPWGDLASSSPGVFFAFRNGTDQTLGYCGYEEAGETLAFICSCVVPEGHRGKGLGRAMVAALIEMLVMHGRPDIYLLTYDADPFFARFGFELIPRHEAPEALRALPQFAMKECDVAVLMRRVT